MSKFRYNFVLMLSLLFAVGTLSAQNGKYVRKAKEAVNESHVAGVSAKVPMVLECPADAFVGYIPVAPTSAVTSATGPGYVAAQSFTGVDQLIGGISLWGLQLFHNGSAWAECFSDPMAFEIKFYEDNNGAPGTVTNTFTVSSAAGITNELLFDAYPIYHFDFVFDSPVSMANGWFSVCTTNQECWFLWVNTTEDLGTAMQYTSTGGWAAQDNSLPYCLIPGGSDGAPDAVTNFAVTAGANGALTANLAWTYPTVNLGGAALTEITTAYLYVNNEIVETYTNPAVGGAATEDLAFLTSGMYNFKIVCANSEGDGAPATIESWIGADVPGEPLNVTLVNQNDNGYLTWGAPTTGLHGGYFNGSITGYSIVRTDGATFTVAGDVTSLLDETIPGAGSYRYTVTAENANGIGGTAISNPVMLGMGDLLIYEDFTNGVPPAGWSVQGAGATNWIVGTPALAGGVAPELKFSWTPEFNGLSRFVSPVVNTSGLTALMLEYKELVNDYSGSGYILAIQTTSDGGTTWNSAFEYQPASIPAHTANVIISNNDVGSANFQLAFVFDGNSYDINFWHIDDVILGEANANDVAANAIHVPAIIAAGAERIPTGTVTNIGSEPATFTVTLTATIGGSQTYTSTKNVTALGSIESETISFDPWTPAEGLYTLIMTATLANDANTGNNTVSSEVNAQGGVTRNLVVIEDATGTWCGYCPGAANGIEDLIANGNVIGAIAYHSGSTPESLNTPEGEARISYYGITGFPTVKIDGSQEVVGGTGATGTMFATYLPIVEARAALPTPITVEIQNPQVAGNVFTANVVVGTVGAVSATDLVLHAAVTESEIANNWQGMTELNHVERAMFPNENGTPLNLSSKSQTVPVTFTIGSGWNPEHLELVVFVQSVGSKEIYNGAKLDVPAIVVETYNVTVTIVNEDNNPLQGVSVAIAGITTSVTDANGQVVYTGVPNGTYNYTLTKAGYITQTGSLTVNGANVNATVTMLAEPVTGAFKVYFNNAVIGTEPVVVNGLPTDEEIVAYFEVENAYSETKEVKIRKNVVNAPAGTSNTFCWAGNCYPPQTNESLGFMTMTPDQVIEDEFSGHYYPTGVEGTAVIEYTVFDHNTPADAFTFTVHYIAGTATETFDVTFKVDLSEVEGFDPATENIYISGIPSWAEPGSDDNLKMTDADNNLEYEITFNLMAGDYQFKFFRGTGWLGGEWTGDPNRTITVTGDMTYAINWGAFHDGLNNLSAEQIMVYPNPTSTVLNISNNANVQIFDLNGKIIFTAENVKTVDVSSFNEGTYIVRISSENQTRTMKINIVK